MQDPLPLRAHLQNGLHSCVAALPSCLHRRQLCFERRDGWVLRAAGANVRSQASTSWRSRRPQQDLPNSREPWFTFALPDPAVLTRKTVLWRWASVQANCMCTAQFHAPDSRMRLSRDHDGIGLEYSSLPHLSRRRNGRRIVAGRRVRRSRRSRQGLGHRRGLLHRQRRRRQLLRRCSRLCTHKTAGRWHSSRRASWCSN